RRMNVKLPAVQANERSLSMSRLIIAVLVSLAMPGLVIADDPVGFLQIERKNAKGAAERELVAYEPREGDLVFYDDFNLAWTVLFAYAGSGPPLHMGIVFKQANGKLAVLEAG